MKMDQLFTVKELSDADWFPCRERTIRKLIHSGKLKVLHTSIQGGDRYRIKESEIERYLKTLER